MAATTNDPNISPTSRNDIDMTRKYSRSFSFEGSPWKQFEEKPVKLEWSANSLGVSRNGKLAVLAAKRGFLLAEFADLSKIKKFPCTNRWEPGALEFNPHPANEDLFASVTNQKVDIWNVKELSNNGSPRIALSGHTRTISDINWNYFDPKTLLTCSMDTYINMWDIRQNRRPASTFTTVAGSSQVRWNRMNKNLFASAHDSDVRIWDIRKGNLPFVYIAGHLSKIHGLDWSPTKETYFVTASNDSTVKFWNMMSPKQPRASINNGAPVWKARYTPFGNGLVTILVPQLRRSENSLFLWNTSEFKTPVHKYEGHTDVILEFKWRTQEHDDQTEYQLISLSKDQTLRIWKADKKTVQAITGEYDKSSSHMHVTAVSPLSPIVPFAESSSVESSDYKKLLREIGNTSPALSSTMKEVMLDREEKLTRVFPERPDRLDLNQENLNTLNLLHTKPYIPLSPRSPPQSPPERALSPLSGRKTAFRKHGGAQAQDQCVESVSGDIQVQALQQEFSLINRNNPMYRIEVLNSEKRLCIVSAKVGQISMRIHISFPLSYPDKTPPTFHYSKDSKVDQESRKKISAALNEVAQQHVKFNRTCLEPCLRQLVLQFDQLRIQDNVRGGDALTPLTPPANHMQFFSFKRVEAGSDPSYQDSTVPFPRTCGARFCGIGDRLVIFSPPEKFSNIVHVEKSLRSLSALYAYLANLEEEEEDYGGDMETRFTKKPKAVGTVYISDTSSLLPCSKFLAQNYVLNGDDPSELCLRNASLAQTVNREDLVQTWSLLAKILDKKLAPSLNLDKAFLPPWACHPFGKKLVDSLFKYYEGVKDIQMLALMSCMLAKQHLPSEMKDYFLKSTLEENKVIPKQKFTSSDGFSMSPEFPYNVYNKLSSGDESWSPPTFVEEKLIDPEEESKRLHYQNCRLLDPSNTFRYDQFKRFYGEILYRWNLTLQRTEVMKHVTEQPEQHRGSDICLECTTCKKVQREPCCVTCKSIIVKCSVCRVGVRGLLSYCVVCGHGGHMFHLMDWFQKNDWCATGCGCCCLRIGKFSPE